MGDPRAEVGLEEVGEGDEVFSFAIFDARTSGAISSAIVVGVIGVK